MEGSQGADPVAMLTTEVAELTGEKHAHVMRAALVDRVEQLEAERRHPNVVALPAIVNAIQRC